MSKSLGLALAAVVVSGGMALAAQQGAAAKKFLVKSPPSGNKKIVFLSKNTTATLMGNPVMNGASFNVALTMGGTQCIPLPASGWTSTPVGFKYKDPQLANGPVKNAIIKKTPSGNFLLKVIAKGAAITIAPGNPTLTYGTNFKINGGGDEYCASTGTAAPKKNDAKTFLVKADTGTACTAAACSSPSGAFLDASLSF
jgi:hypothetical protein